MAIQGLITNVGITKCREAALNEGFHIVPTGFSVSSIQSALDPTRTTANSGVWYQGLISSRVPESYNIEKFICTIPPDQIPQGQYQQIREIYIWGTLNSVDFLFAIGQPNRPVEYDPSGSVTLDVDISLVNYDLSSLLVFQYTQATEILEHQTDPNSHPELIAEMNKAGMYLDSGGVAYIYKGQWYDKKAEFYGTRATAVRVSLQVKRGNRLVACLQQRPV